MSSTTPSFSAVSLDPPPANESLLSNMTDRSKFPSVNRSHRCILSPADYYAKGATITEVTIGSILRQTIVFNDEPTPAHVLIVPEGLTGAWAHEGESALIVETPDSQEHRAFGAMHTQHSFINNTQNQPLGTSGFLFVAPSASTGTRKVREAATWGKANFFYNAEGKRTMVVDKREKDHGRGQGH